MKNIVIKLISAYQAFLSQLIRQLIGVPHMCRFVPTCSEYARNEISRKGIALGSYLSFIRILKCQPFYKGAKT